MDGGDIRPGHCGQHGEGRGLVAVAGAAILAAQTFRWPPQARNRHEGEVEQGEAVLGLRVFLAGELEKGRCRDQAATALGKGAVFGAEVEHRPAPALAASGLRRRKTEPHWRQRNDTVLLHPHHGANVADADVVGRRQIRFPLMLGCAQPLLVQRLDVLPVADVLLVIVAHRGKVGRYCTAGRGFSDCCEARLLVSGSSGQARG
jgi:hypothetical protein